VAQKNHALERASHAWALALDADEALSAELRAELLDWKHRTVPEAVAGFSMPRRTWFEGRWIRFGDWAPRRLVRLVRPARARYVGGRVHERLDVDGRVQPLAGALDHYSYRDAADREVRARHYAALWAESRFERGRRAGPLAPLAHAAGAWLRGLVLRGGLLDGPLGVRIANSCARETALKYRLLRSRHSGASGGG
jgi:(heptosyl)LPS beta-1,4-glucosyltransferase